MECIIQLLSISADIAGVITAIVAIFISVYALTHQREHDRISVAPRLAHQADSKADEKGKSLINWIVENQGLGPAIIDEFCIIIDGHEFKTPTADTIKDSFPGNYIAEVKTHIYRKGDLLAAGNEKILLSVTVDSGVKFPRFLQTIQWRIDYSSFYGVKDKLIIPRINRGSTIHFE